MNSTAHFHSRPGTGQGRHTVEGYTCVAGLQGLAGRRAEVAQMPPRGRPLGAPAVPELPVHVGVPILQAGWREGEVHARACARVCV